MTQNGDALQMIHEIGDAVLADDMDLSDYESTFIEDMSVKLRRLNFRMSVNQEKLLLRLWNKSKGRV